MDTYHLKARENSLTNSSYTKKILSHININTKAKLTLKKIICI